MEYKVYKEEDYNISNWAGGKTRQLAIFPASGNYLERRFVWRLSSATCELEESDFSKLPDFDRVLIVLKGKVVLAHQDVRVARLDELEQDRFDGAWKTKSFGQITDYNLMTAKGNQGFLDVLTLTDQSVTPDTEDYPNYELRTQAFYLREGFATVTINGETIMMKPEEQLVINYKKDETVKVSVMGDGHLIRAQVFYNYHSEETEATEIPKERASFDDFLTCEYLANSRFHWSNLFFKKQKYEWIDEELQMGIDKIEKFYLPTVLYLVWLCIFVVWGAHRLQGAEWVFVIIAITLVYMLLLSPLMYMAVVPKPVRPHIKNIMTLTPYEQRVRQAQLDSNERLDHILKKYKFTATDTYDENGNRTDVIYKDKKNK
jgi:Uncharacterized protein conserved in bacteria